VPDRAVEKVCPVAGFFAVTLVSLYTFFTSITILSPTAGFFTKLLVVSSVGPSAVSSVFFTFAKSIFSSVIFS